MMKKNYPTIRSTLLILSLASLFAVSLSGCGSSDDEYDEEPYSESDEYIDDQYDEMGDSLRSGRLTLNFELQHSGSKEEAKEDGGFAKANWKHTMAAQLEQKVELSEDLRDFIDINSSMSIEEREERFGSDSFILINESAKASGSFSYESDFLSHTPNSSGPDWLRDFTSGSGVVDYIDLDSIEISRFGKGYEFELELAGEGQARGALLSGESASDVNKDISEFELEAMSFEDEFQVYPIPEKKRFDLYPERDSLDSLSEETRVAYFQMQRELYKAVESVYRDKKQPHINDFAGAITEASKDKLTIKYVHDGHSIIPRHAGATVLMAPPTQNMLTITITVAAD